jgi:hypothetical protein
LELSNGKDVDCLTRLGEGRPRQAARYEEPPLYSPHEEVEGDRRPRQAARYGQHGGKRRIAIKVFVPPTTPE